MSRDGVEQLLFDESFGTLVWGVKEPFRVLGVLHHGHVLAVVYNLDSETRLRVFVLRDGLWFAPLASRHVLFEPKGEGVVPGRPAFPSAELSGQAHGAVLITLPHPGTDGGPFRRFRLVVAPRPGTAGFYEATLRPEGPVPYRD